MSKCNRCGGSGIETDNSKLGEQLRLRRVKAGMGVRSMARACDVSPSYITNLEQGLRNWKPDMISKYKQITKNQVTYGN